MQGGRLTSVRLTEGFLERVEAYDRSGPRLNAVLEVNPQAREIAETLDRERASGGIRGPLHGIPLPPEGQHRDRRPAAHQRGLARPEGLHRAA